MIGGAKFFYNRPYNEAETLTCDGPLTEDLVLEVHFIGFNSLYNVHLNPEMSAEDVMECIL